ncbi:hypothetical protein HQ533_03800 [Candidatus Woesearchaeota archaeon]|nr:hypothetical protein [Candidatus Woesearchaeota archaeon]
MGLFEWIDGLGSKLKWYDFSLLKLSVFFFTLFLLTAWTGFREFALGFDWYWHLIIAVIVAIPLMKKMFSN